MFGFSDEADVLVAADIVLGEDAFEFAQSLAVGDQEFVLVELDFEWDSGVQDGDAGAAIVEQQLLVVVEHAFEDRHVDAFADKVVVAVVLAVVAGFDDDVHDFAERFDGAPDVVIYSTPYTMRALAQDAWWKPEVPTGLTEDRWIRAIEIRPSTVAGRTITHHALARLQQEEDPEDLGAASEVGPGILMEWAVGKQGEIMRENSGKLIKADSSIVWDIHYSSAGEEVTDTVELGLYLYPKDAPPKFRQVLSAWSSLEGGSGNLSIPPNQITATERFHVLRQKYPGKEEL